MKILKVVHTFLPNYFGGTEVLVSNLAKELSKENEVNIFYVNPLAKNPNYQIKKHQFDGYIGWEVQKDIRENTSLEDTYNDKKLEEVFKEKIEELQPDVIHFHHLLHLSAKFPAIAKEAGIPNVITFHDFWFQCLAIKRVDLEGEMCEIIDIEKCATCRKRKTAFGFWSQRVLNKIGNKKISDFIKRGYLLEEKIKRLLLGNRSEKEIEKRNLALLKSLDYCDKIIAPTKYLFDEFIKWGVSGDKMFYSADGIDDGFFNDIKKNQNNKFRFAFIGSIVKEKGLHVLINAFDELRENDCELYVYGDLNFDKRYSAEILKKSKNNKKIIFKGTFPSEKIGEIFKEIDCLIMPSIWAENAPLVIKNALLAKTPVIASDIPGVKDNLIHNNNALLFKMGDSQDLKEKMTKMLVPDFYNKLRGNIKKIKTVRDNAEELFAIYQELIKK